MAAVVVAIVLLIGASALTATHLRANGTGQSAGMTQLPS